MSSIPWHRERIKEQLQHHIGEVIARKMRDPRIPPVVTVTDIRLSADTRNATVYVSMFNTEEEKNTACTALNHAAPYIQKIIGLRINLKNTPKLLFKLDHSIERGFHVSEILKEIRHELE